MRIGSAAALKPYRGESIVATIAHAGVAGAGGTAQQAAQHFAHGMVETAQESLLAVMKDGGHEIG